MRSLLVALVLAAMLGAGTPARADPRVDHGQYLVTLMGCSDCHTPRTTPPGPFLSGGNKQAAGQANTPNITPDPATGIGNWTDDQVIYALTNGKRPDGTTIGPPMPIRSFQGLSDDDVGAVVAYLRTVPPVHHAVPRGRYTAKPPDAFALPDDYGPPVTHVAAPREDDPVARGKYLVGTIAHCLECHSPLGADGLPDLEDFAGAGGQLFKGPWGLVASANLTPAGLGPFSDDEVKRIVTTGVKPDGTNIVGPMDTRLYSHLTDRDLSAIVAYLRSLPPR